MNKIDFKFKGKSGIYEICNVITNKIYIGSSKDLYNRLHEHLHNLKRNKCHNMHLQYSFNKYGENNFIYNILELCDKDERFIREQYWITKLEPKYNKSLNVVGNLNLVMSQECKDKISKTRKERIHSGEIIIAQKRKIYKYDLDGNFIKGYDTIKEACIDNNIFASTIYRNMNKEYKFMKKHQFVWSSEKLEKINVPIKKKIIKNGSNKLTFLLNILTGTIETFKSRNSCAEFLKTSSDNIQQYMRKNIVYNGQYRIFSELPLPDAMTDTLYDEITKRQ